MLFEHPRFLLKHKRSPHVFEICLPPQTACSGKFLRYFARLYILLSVYMSLSTLLYFAKQN